MHLTDGANNSAGQFVDRNLVTPTPGTQVEEHWLNMVQGELKSILDDAGVTPVKGTWNQVLVSLRTLFVRAAGNATQTITGLKTFTSKVVIAVSGGVNGLEVTNAHTGPTVSAENNSSGPAVKATSGHPDSPAVVLEYNTGAGRVGGFARFGAYSTTGTFPGSPQPGDTVFLAGANNKLYTWDGTSWQAHW